MTIYQAAANTNINVYFLETVSLSACGVCGYTLMELYKQLSKLVYNTGHIWCCSKNDICVGITVYKLNMSSILIVIKTQAMYISGVQTF